MTTAQFATILALEVVAGGLLGIFIIAALIWLFDVFVEWFAGRRQR